MRHENIQIGDQVVYIPNYLLIGDRGEMIKDENLGTVTSKNDTYIFVRYLGKSVSQATEATDLFTIRNRQDLQDKLNSDQNVQESDTTEAK